MRNHPVHATGRLVFKRNGTFASIHNGSWLGDASGTYQVRGNWISLKYTLPATTVGGKKTRQKFDPKFYLRAGQIWQDGGLCADGSFIYVRPGKKPRMPHSYKDWPHFPDFSP